MWIPLGDTATGLDFENHTSHPSRGDILLYSGGFSETEFYSPTATVALPAKWTISGQSLPDRRQRTENLQSFGEFVLWKGAQEIIFSLMNYEQRRHPRKIPKIF